MSDGDREGVARSGVFWRLLGGTTNTEAQILACLIWRGGQRKRDAEIERLWISQGQQVDFPIIVEEGLVTREGHTTHITDWYFDCRKMVALITPEALAERLSAQYPHRVFDIS